MKSTYKLVFLSSSNNQLVNVIVKVRYHLLATKTIEYLGTNLKI